MAAALRERFGVGKGDRILVQSQNCNQMFESMFACFRLGAVWVPTNFRQTPEEVAYLAEASGARGHDLQRRAFPDHAAAALRRCRVRHRDRRRRGSGRSMTRWSRSTSGRVAGGGAGRARRSLLVLLHLRHHRPPEGRGADPWPDGLRGHQPPLRPDAGADAGGRLAGRRAAVAWGRRSPADAGRARGEDGPAARRAVRRGEAWGLVERWRVSTMFTVPTIVKLLVEHPCASGGSTIRPCAT